MEQKVPVSVLIMTRNEELNIRECLESFKWAAEIVIVDSHSTDKTIEIARQYTDKIYPYTWNGKNPKKSWSLENPQFSYDWVLMPDADERGTAGFKEELEKIVTDSNDRLAGYVIKYDYWFLGKYLRFGDPVRKMILFRKSKVKFEQFDVSKQEGVQDLEVGHEHPITNGKIGSMKNPLLHDDKRPLHFYLDRHNRYSTWEAGLLLQRSYSNETGDEVSGSLKGSSVQLRRFMKKIFLKLPFKPLIYFIYGYIFRLGFLDGYPGLCYNVCKSIYAYQIALKLHELKLRAKWDVPGRTN